MPSLTHACIGFIADKSKSTSSYAHTYCAVPAFPGPKFRLQFSEPYATCSIQLNA